MSTKVIQVRNPNGVSRVCDMEQKYFTALTRVNTDNSDNSERFLAKCIEKAK